MAPENPSHQRTIDDYLAESATLTEALAALAAAGGDSSRGVHWRDGFLPWPAVIQQARKRASWLAGRSCAGPRCDPNPPHVGLLLGNSPEFVTWLCAAALSPLVAVGLNDTRAAAALARDVAVADCMVVLYDDRHAQLAGELARHTSVPVLPVSAVAGEGDAATAAPADHSASARNADADADAAAPGFPAAEPDDLVALIFTSGTSGDPKAVRVTHRKIWAPARMLADRFGLGADDCFYNAMPMFHSNALLVAWPLALLTGGNLALREKFSASGWLEDVRHFGATFANYVGAPLSYILATPAREDDAENPMRIVYGNEAPPAVREGFARRFGVRVVDGFGSTEGGVAVSRTPDTPPTALGPLPASALVVAPGTDTECPPAELGPGGEVLNADEAVGELIGRGAGLFAGYYNDPAADAERMRGGRYRSGDLVYVDADGYVYFAGRASTWMRVGGENLAAAPIERVLARHPQISEVAVYGVPSPDGPGDEVAAAVVLAATAAGVDGPDGIGRGGTAEGNGRQAAAASFAAGLREFLAAQDDLAPRQWPRYVRITGALPRTASFKIRARDLTAQGTAAGTDVLLERTGKAPADYAPA